MSRVKETQIWGDNLYTGLVIFKMDLGIDPSLGDGWSLFFTIRVEAATEGWRAHTVIENEMAVRHFGLDITAQERCRRMKAF